MTVAATNTAAAQNTDTVGLGRTRLAENFDMFMTLLTTQMKAQDPLSPLDSNQFTAQLVQMTGVEQQLAANDMLKKLVANSGANISSAVSLIGTSVRAQSDDAKLANGQANWTFNLPSPAADLKVEVLDAQGKTVFAQALKDDDLKAGDHAVTWDGKNQSGAKLPDGTYTLRVTAKDSAAKAIATTTYVQGLVSGVEQVDGAPVITVGGTRVGLSQVTSVSLPVAPAASNTSTASGGDTSTGATSSKTSDQTSDQAA
jgi:flagellar basal-body rod modification protein FlgD